MHTKKEKRGCHKMNGELCKNFFDTKEVRKYQRKMFKSVRHKLLMHIPLTEEEAYRKKYGIEANTKMLYDGNLNIKRHELQGRNG